MSDDDFRISGSDEMLVDWEGAVRKLRFLQETHHVLLKELADHLGVKHSFLQEVFDGRTRPSDRVLTKAAQFFGVPLTFLTSGQSLAVRRPDAKPEVRRTGSEAVTSPRSTGRSAAPRAPSTPGTPGAKKKRSLGLKDLAVRHQALVEALIQRGVISANDYNDVLRRVQQR